MFGSLKEFRKFKELSQEDLGRKLGLGKKWKNYPNWETGRAPFPPDIQAKILEMGYDGPWPELGGEVTRADLESLRDEVRTQAAWMREELRKENVALAADLQEALKRLAALQDSLAGKRP
jgi:hypothetical protein